MRSDSQTSLPRYDRSQTYRWNYDHAPDPPPDIDVPAVPGSWTFCGRPVPSPLGIPAGPLLNGRWILYYAALGFDVLTYKTARSVARECYPLPNLVPVQTASLQGGERGLPASEAMNGSWAVSFGMPSMSPDVWRADVEWTRRQLPPEKVLSVSVVASVQPNWTLDDLAADYARCARWAVESGADCVEVNFSCPNVATCDGQLYQQADAAGSVARQVRDAIGATPLLIKIGYVPGEAAAAALIDAVVPAADALAMTNCLVATVEGPAGPVFDGQPRGIGGEAIRAASAGQVRLFSRLIRQRGLPTKIIGVGGIFTAEHVRQYLDAGAQSVHLATAAMLDPLVGCQIRRELVGTRSPAAGLTVGPRKGIV
jgi:dihydroorotate dehydrogenase (NAD+) catalytic subunit